MSPPDSSSTVQSIPTSSREGHWFESSIAHNKAGHDVSGFFYAIVMQHNCYIIYSKSKDSYYVGLHRFLFRIEFDDITPITKVTPEKPLTGSLNGMLHSRPNPRPFTKKRPSKAGRVEK